MIDEFINDIIDDIQRGDDMNTTTKDRDKEVRDYAIDRLKDMKEYGQEASAVHHEIFNTDYYIIGRHQATEWLGDDVFDIIGVVKEYEEDNFGECSTAQVFITIDDDPTTNLTNLSTGNSVNVFPTLATQSVTVALSIQAGAQENVSMEIVDMLGKTLHQQTERAQGKQSFQLNVGDLVAGNYFLKLQIGSETLTEKFIKQ